MHYEASLEFQSSATFLVGDLNVNTFNSNQATEKCRLFIETSTNMIRQDTVLDNADEPTRPGGATHLDCIAFSTVVEARVTNYWNHSWADKIDDHNTLGMSLEVKSHPTDEEPPKIDPRSSPLRYKYEDFSPEEITLYCNTLEDLIRAGIGDRIHRHLVLARQPNTTQEHEKQAKLAIGACLMSGAMHHSADMHLRHHRKIPHANLWKAKTINEVIRTRKEKTEWEK